MFISRNMSDSSRQEQITYMQKTLLGNEVFSKLLDTIRVSTARIRGPNGRGNRATLHETLVLAEFGGEEFLDTNGGHYGSRSYGFKAGQRDHQGIVERLGKIGYTIVTPKAIAA